MWDLDTAGYPAHNKIPYVINPTRPGDSPVLPSGTTEQEIVDAIRSVFQRYENIPTSKLEFEFLGVDHTARFSVDGILLVTLDYTDPGVSCTSSNYKISTLAPVVGAYTLPGSGQQVHVERLWSVIDSDIALCDVPLSLNAAPGTLDLEVLLTHELGHMFGLGHSILQPTTMTGYGGAFSKSQRTLSRDDELGISTLYPEPDFFASTGTLDGVVQETDETGALVGEVFGAHITVTSAATGEAVTETITGVSAVDPVTGRATEWDLDKTSGRFVVSGLPPGSYRIQVDACDGPATVASTGKVINLPFFDHDSSGPRRDFGYLLDPTDHIVTAGIVTDVGTLRVGPYDPDFPNVDSGVMALHESEWIRPAVACTGETTLVAIPKGVNTSLDDQFSVYGAEGVLLLNPRWSSSGNSILVDVEVPASAPPGPHHIVVANSHGFSLVHGGLRIATGAPTIESVSMPCPQAGSPIEVHGSDFTLDTSVYLDGLLAASIVVESPALIRAEAVDGVELPAIVTILSDTGEGSSQVGGVVSTETPRLGAPPNPPAFLPGQTSGPVIGCVWDPLVDHAAFMPSALLDYLFLAAAPANAPLPPHGTALVLPPLLVGTPALAVAGTAFAVLVPNSCSLIGYTLSAQAMSTNGLTFFLTNALDVTIGSA
jgi:hypothetical protein